MTEDKHAEIKAWFMVQVQEGLVELSNDPDLTADNLQEKRDALFDEIMDRLIDTFAASQEEADRIRDRVKNAMLKFVSDQTNSGL